MTARGVVLLLALTSLADAGEIDRAEITYEQGEYTVDAVVRLRAPPAAVRAVVTDYGRLDRLSPTFKSARIIERYDARHLRRLLVIDTCVLFFCKEFDMVEDVEELDNGDVVTTVVPAESDFHHGEARWRILPGEDGGTSLRFTAVRAPSFWIPPLIGPWLMKHKLRRELEESAQRIERLAGGDGHD